MGPRHRRIYECVASAGSSGATIDALTHALQIERAHPSPGAYAMLRVKIHEINHIIEPIHQKIISRRAHGMNGKYFLTSKSS